MAYRTSRNLEASVIQYIEDQLVEDWTNVAVEKTFTNIDISSLPAICVRIGITEHTRAEIGETSTYRTANILIDIFAKNDGQKLDLKDWLIIKLKSGLPYYEYIINNGQIQDKTQNGRINVLNIDDVPVDFDIDKEKLDVMDRYRWLITLSVSLGRIES